MGRRWVWQRDVGWVGRRCVWLRVVGWGGGARCGRGVGCEAPGVGEGQWGGMHTVEIPLHCTAPHPSPPFTAPQSNPPHTHSALPLTRGRVPLRVPHVQPCTRGVREHVQSIEFRLGSVEVLNVRRAEGLMVRPVFLPLALDLGEGVLARGLAGSGLNLLLCAGSEGGSATDGRKSSLRRRVSMQAA